MTLRLIQPPLFKFNFARYSDQNAMNPDESEIGAHDLQTMNANVGLFKPASDKTLKTIRQRHQAGKATFLLSTQPVFAESAQAALLLCHAINSMSAQEYWTNFKTFFCNSRIEGLHGAIKIARHNAYMEHADSTGEVLIYDTSNFYEALFDPLTQGAERALAPGLFFVDKATDLFDQLDGAGRSVCAVVVCLHDAITAESLNEAQKMCHEKKTIFVIDTSHLCYSAIESVLKRLLFMPDIVVWGEALTDYQVPFGAFSMTDAVYQPWRTVDTCFLHSSTYGGNSLTTSIVRDYLVNKIAISTEIQHQLQAIEAHSEARIEAFRTYVNPLSPLVYKAAMLDLDIIKAKGSWITVKGSQGEAVDLIDCIGGAGCNLRGYNPDDIVSDVVETYDPKRDNWGELAHYLRRLTGLERAFPAVSGACAVEITMTMAMLANKERRTLLVFKGNFAGHTLIALNGSEELSLRAPFDPLYQEVIYLDIFSPNATIRLLELLRSGAIALVWFEVLQGSQLDRVSIELMSLVFEHREAFGYFIGIDEILNGMFRTGPFISVNVDQYKPDLVTLSKGLSDMTFPIAAGLVSETVYRRARSVNEALVTRYETLYLNGLGAHISLHGLTRAMALYDNVQQRSVAQQLKSDLDAVAERSPLLKAIRGEGLHLHLVLDLDRFPLSLFGKDIAELLISRLCISQGHVLQFFCRLLPPLSLTKAEANAVVAGIEKAFEISPFSLFIFGLKRVFTFFCLVASDLIKSRCWQLLQRVSGRWAG